MSVTVAHTSLALNLDQWRGELGRYFGFGRAYNSMTSSQKADIDAVIDRGLRQFYAPPLMPDGTVHIWSFMRPTMNITVHAEYTTGTLSDVVSTPTGTATFVGSILPTGISSGVLQYTHPTSGVFTTLHIRARTSNTAVTLEDAVAADEMTSGSSTYSINDGIYSLPTSFGGMEGDITLEAASGYAPMRQVDEETIRSLFLNNLVQKGTPTHFCVRPRRNPNADHESGGDVSIGMYTRYELVMFPMPDATYKMSFRYIFMFPGVVDMTTAGAVLDMTPPGIAYHHETILASCLAIAEEYADSPNGKYREYFKQRVAASVAMDRKIAGSPLFGNNADRSDIVYSRERSVLRSTVTYTP